MKPLARLPLPSHTIMLHPCLVPLTFAMSDSPLLSLGCTYKSKFAYIQKSVWLPKQMNPAL